jgi:4-aminobutyrate aminotransferase / (S)-3-amino-2-methylpropionate transaminase / 5-aminovalerate transaminase
MKNSTLDAKRNKVVAKGFASVKPVYIESARGALLYDGEGTEYIDFAGGIAVMNVGHSNPKVIKAIQEQAAKFTHTCFMVTPYEVAVKVADRLCNLAPIKAPARVVLFNSGVVVKEPATEECATVIQQAFSKRLNIISCGQYGNVIRTMMPLVITDSQLEKGMDILDESFASLNR